MIVGEASVVVKYDSAEAAAALETQADADLAGLGDAAAVAGNKAGEDLRKGVKEGASGVEDDLEAVGAAGGLGLREGVSSETEKIGDDVGEDAENIGKSFKDKLGGALTALGNVAGSAVPGVKELSEHTEKLGSAAENAGVETEGLSNNGLLAMAGAVVGVVGVSADLGEKMQTLQTDIANAAQISVKSAGQITDAFLGTAGKVPFSAEQIAEAYKGVAGQLGSLQGKALTAPQALKVMNAAMDLATATGTDLTSTTSTLGSVMQAYQVPVKDAARVSDQLYVASQRTGLGVDGLGGALAKVRAGLGVMSPSLAQTNGLLVDMADHGETGRKGLSLLTTAFTAIVKPASDFAKAQQELKDSTDELPPSLKTLATQYDAGKITSQDLTTATEGMTGAQAQAWAAFMKSKSAMETAKQASDALGFSTVNAQGKFIGVGAVLGKLHDQIQGMSNEQATAKLSADGFGSSASKLLSIVQAGPAAFDAATAAVTRTGTAHQAATKASADLGEQWKTLGSEAEDWGTDIGKVAVPALTVLMKGFSDLIKITEDDWKWWIQLGETIGSFVGKAVGDVSNFVSEVSNEWQTLESDVARVWTAIEGDVSRAWSAIVGDVSGAWHTIVGDVSTGVSDVEGVIAGAAGGVAHAATTVWDGIATAAIDAWDSVKSAIRVLIQGGISVIDGFVSDMEQAGKDLIDGLLHGIESAGGAVINAAKSLADKVISPFKKALSIFSPSQVFHGFGVNIGEGLAQGIESSASRVLAATQSLVNAAKPPSSATLEPVGAAGTAAAAAAAPSTGTASAEQAWATAATTTSSSIQNSMTNLATLVSQEATNAANRISTAAENTSATVSRETDRAAQAQITAIDRMSSTVTSETQRAVQAQTNAATRTSTIVTGETQRAVQTQTDAIESAAQKHVAAIEKAADSIKNETTAEKASATAREQAVRDSAKHQEQAVENAAKTVETAQRESAKSQEQSVESAAKSVETAQKSSAAKQESDIKDAASAIENSAKQAASQTENSTKQAATQQTNEVKTQTSALTKIAQQGSTELNTLISAITSGSQQTLNSALTGLTRSEMTSLVDKLDATHDKALTAMASQIETTWKQAVTTLAKTNEIAANSTQATQITDAAATAAKLISDNSAITNDTINPSADPATAAAQLVLDRDTLTSDTTIGNDQSKLDTDQSGSLAQSQDQLQLAKDQAAQTVQTAKDNALLSAAQATATAAQATQTNTATIADNTTPAATPAASPTFIFYLEGSGQTTTADWMNEIGIAMTIGTLPAAVPNPSLPGNAALVA